MPLPHYLDENADVGYASTFCSAVVFLTKKEEDSPLTWAMLVPGYLDERVFQGALRDRQPEQPHQLEARLQLPHRGTLRTRLNTENINGATRI